MAQRLLQITVPEADHDRLKELLDQQTVVARWLDDRDDREAVIQVLVRADAAEAIMDDCDSAFGDSGRLRLIVLPVEAALPRPDADPDDDPDKDETRSPPGSMRVSREELVADIHEGMGRLVPFLAMTVLSTIVACAGLMTNDTTVVIGAMVIAPLLSPNVGMALATTLGDLQLGRLALQRSALGIGLSFLLALIAGWALTIDPEVPAIARRTEAGLESIALALAAGAAGTLAFTIGLAGAVIGVMVAVALLPPLVVCGLLLGSGDLAGAAGAGLLTALNVVCINLAGVATFLAQGVRPRTWYDSDRARRALMVAAPLWVGWLVALAVVLHLAGF